MSVLGVYVMELYFESFIVIVLRWLMFKVVSYKFWFYYLRLFFLFIFLLFILRYNFVIKLFIVYLGVLIL